MAGTKVNDILLTSGQNEGIEPAVLPTPQLLSATNMRLRKGSRWGKRFGHTAQSTSGIQAAQTRFRAAGGGKTAAGTCFVIVDDQIVTYDQVTGAFVTPPGLLDIATDVSRVRGAVSGWLPDTSYFPMLQRSTQAQRSTPCAGCYAFGYLWYATTYIDATNGPTIQVVAVNATDQTVVSANEFTAVIVGFGGLQFPRLALVGTTLVLTYLYFDAAATSHVAARTLTSVGGGFSGETLILNFGSIVVTYDVSSYDATQFLLAYTQPANANAMLVTAATLAITTTAGLIADSSGNPLTQISVVGSPSSGIYVGYGVGATPSSKVRVFTANFGATVGTATLSATDAIRPLLAITPAGTAVFAVYSSIGGSFKFRTVSSAALAGAIISQQYSATPIAVPFTIGNRTYLWVQTETQSGVNYATLLRLSQGAVSSPVSCPIELSCQDYLVSNGASGALDLRGVPAVSQIGTTATFAVPVMSLYATYSGIFQGHDLRVLQAKHLTDDAARRSLSSVYADSSTFLTAGALTRVDDRGAVEEGFAHAPTVGAITPSAGAGSLTPSVDYYYTAVYKRRNSNGRLEVSAPATPVKVTMAAGQNTNSVPILSLGMTARAGTTIEVYRTLANGQTFYLCGFLDSTFGYVAFVDLLADAVVSLQKALYTQVGQTLANAFPPASRFGCAGGQRLFLGGQIRPDVVQASKLIFGDQSPSFADSDAFRIVLPAPCTGLAWMDALVMFTTEGIYIASGDGPDDSGVGDFGNLSRMPYELGCIEPRSIFTGDDGTFFQTSRGLYLLPRGFGAPVPAGDNVQTTLAGFSVITGCVALTKSTEQSVIWTFTDAGAASGGRIVYDLAHKAWSVDFGIGAPVGIGAWLNGEVLQFQPLKTDPLPLLVSDSSYSDGGNAINAVLQTGDLRPFGVLSEGVISRLQLLAELRSACTLTVSKFTEWAGSNSSRVFALAAGDYQVGQLTVTEESLGNSELRDAMRLRLQFSETSSVEGLAFIAMSLEHEQGEGLKRVFDLSRIT